MVPGLDAGSLSGRYVPGALGGLPTARLPAGPVVSSARMALVVFIGVVPLVAGTVSAALPVSAAPSALDR
jgi:hypothetical protein